MATAFVAKIVFFGAYISVVILFIAVSAGAVCGQFTSYFIALYLMEALYPSALVLREVSVIILLLTSLLCSCTASRTCCGTGRSCGSQAHEHFNAGETIIEHVSNNHELPLVQLPAVFGIDFSVTKHVFMLWFVAVLVFLIVTLTVRRYLGQDRLIPSGFMNGLEAVVEFVRDDIAQPNVGTKWVMTWTPLILTFFFFILSANAIGLIPIFDTLAVLDRLVLHTNTGSFVNRLIHGGTTATANYNVTAALATITFIAIILAGSKAHGFMKHWKNIVPHGLHPLI